MQASPFHLRQCCCVYLHLPSAPSHPCWAPRHTPAREGSPRVRPRPLSSCACTRKGWHQSLRRMKSDHIEVIMILKAKLPKSIQLHFTECPWQLFNKQVWGRTQAPDRCRLAADRSLRAALGCCGEGWGLLTRHQVEALLLLRVRPHLARQQGQLHRGPVYLQEVGGGGHTCYPPGLPNP